MSDRILLQQAFDAMSYGSAAEREAARIALLDRLEQPEHHKLQAKGVHPAPCARHCEATAFQIVIKNLKAQLAQPEQEPAARLTCEELGYVPLSADGKSVYIDGVGLVRLAQPEQEPNGWRLVPIEPTQEMFRATEAGPVNYPAFCWQAMLSAAPTPPQRTEQEPVATLLLQSKQNYERNFGPSAAADWIYSDLLELLNTAPPQLKPLTDDECDELWEKQVIHITDKFSAREFIRDVEDAHDIKGQA